MNRWLHLHVVRLESYSYKEQARAQVLEDVILALTSVADFMQNASFVVLAGADEVEMQVHERQRKGKAIQQLDMEAVATTEGTSSLNQVVDGFSDESCGDNDGDVSSSSSSATSPQPKAGRSVAMSPTSAAVGNAADIQPLHTLGRRPRRQDSSERQENETVANAEERAEDGRGPPMSPTAAAVGLAADIQPVHALGRRTRNRSSR